MKCLIDTGRITDHLKSVDKVIRKYEQLASEGVEMIVIFLAEIL
jgi:hypothetical protein